MRTPFALATLLTLAPALTAQSVRLRLEPPQGQVTHYLMTMDMFMRGGPMMQMAADSTAPFSTFTTWTTSTITAVDGDEFTQRQVIDSAQAEFPAMPQMAQMMGQMGDLLKGTETVIRMSSRGRMLAMDSKLSPAMQGMVSRMGQQRPDMGMGSSQSMPSFWLLPENAIRVGASWRDSMRVALDSLDASSVMTFTGAYTLQAVSASVAQIGFEGTYGVSSSGRAMTFEVTGGVRLDLRAGRVLETTMEMNGTTPTEMGAMPMRMKMAIRAREGG